MVSRIFNWQMTIGDVAQIGGPTAAGTTENKMSVDKRQFQLTISKFYRQEKFNVYRDEYYNFRGERILTFGKREF